MKTGEKIEPYYRLELFPEGVVGYREKSEGMTTNHLRIVIATLDEIKLRMLNTLMQLQQSQDLKNQTKQ